MPMVAYIAHGCSVQWKNAVDMARSAAAGRPRGPARPSGGSPERHTGSATPQKTRPMPMPAWKQHGEPGEVAELRLVVRSPELDLAVPRAGPGR